MVEHYAYLSYLILYLAESCIIASHSSLVEFCSSHSSASGPN